MCMNMCVCVCVCLCAYVLVHVRVNTYNRFFNINIVSKILKIKIFCYYYIWKDTQIQNYL